MHKSFLPVGCVLSMAVIGFQGGAMGQGRLFEKYCGRVPIPALRFDYPNPSDLNIGDEDCDNGIDDDADGLIDYGTRDNDRDPDCLAGLGPQDLMLKLPFDVVQPIGEFVPARFTGTNRNGDPLGEILINTSGEGGRKVSYLRTDDPNSYSSVTVKALILPGIGGMDAGGPIAIRIQPRDAATKAGMCYFVKVVPGSQITIEKEMGNGTTVELAKATKWDTGEDIKVEVFVSGDPSLNRCYQVAFTAVGPDLTARIAEVNCDVFFPKVQDERTVTITATDSDLISGYVGLRSDNNIGGNVPNDSASSLSEPSVLDFVISDPTDERHPTAPRIAFFNAYQSALDANLDYRPDKITPTDNNTYNRSLAVLADASLAAYLRALGFRVEEFHIGSFQANLLTPEDINDNFDLFWVPSSGGGAQTRDQLRHINIPMVFSEHVGGNIDGAGLALGSISGNEGRTDCGDGKLLSTTTLRIIPEDLGGEPDHPIVRGLADAKGDVVVHDSARHPINKAYPHPGNGVGINGKPFKTVKEVLDERGWGPGEPETQFTGYPPTEGAVALAAMNNPCTGEPFWKVDENGNLATADGRGHISIMVADRRTPRTVNTPETCPDPCEFTGRTVFYWLSDRSFSYATPATLKLLRRMALWTTGLLDTPNRSDVPFQRGDTNADGAIDISDAVAALSWLFLGEAAPPCQDAADSNDDEIVDISDAVFTLSFLFLGTANPPFPYHLCFQGCGVDFTPEAPRPGTNEDPLSIVSCDAYPPCVR